MNKVEAFSSMPGSVAPGLESALPSGADALVVGFLRASIKTKEAVIVHCVDDIIAAAGLVAGAMAAGHKLLLCGNGGSAGDCQHIAAEFVSTLNQNFLRPALPALALTTDSSMLTASANDFGFDGVFERQVEALGRPGDVLVGITTSGNSKNVVRAIELAAGKGLKTVALTGGGKGRIDALVDVAICVPSTNTQCIQESHIAIGHIVCDLVERALFHKEAK